MKKRISKVISLLLTMVMVISMISTTVFAADFSKLKAVDASIDLDGENPGSVTVSIVGTARQEIYGIEGKWDVKNQNGEKYFTLTKIGSDILKFGGMNYADAASGKVMWSDDSFGLDDEGLFNPQFVLSNGTRLMTATYSVAADTPAGDYTVSYYSIQPPQKFQRV